MPLPLVYLLSALLSRQPPEIPAGTALHVRLTSSVGSYASLPGSQVHAQLIAPVTIGDMTAVPAGATVSGTVREVRRVGLGIRHESASLDLDFSSITLPNGGRLPISSQVDDVDSGREHVTSTGWIRNERATSSFSYRACGYARMVLLDDLHYQLAVWAIKSLIIRMPEPEIYYPAGVELTLTLKAPLRPKSIPYDAEGVPRFSAAAIADLTSLASSEPDRTYTLEARPSDLVNFMLIGSRDQLTAAFTAAGWLGADAVSVRSGMRGIAAVFDGRGYRREPMSSLLLDKRQADLTFQKSFNDVAKRHHIRLWRLPNAWRGQDIWIGSATRDVAFAFFRPGRTLTHRIGSAVDEERDKVAYDLLFTGCAQAADWLDRPEESRIFRSASGDLLNTDGRLAAIQVTDCVHPRDAAALDDQQAPMHGRLIQRILRREILSFRSDLIRGNIYWRAFEGLRYLASTLAARRHRERELNVEARRDLRRNFSSRCPGPGSGASPPLVAAASSPISNSESGASSAR